jgi:hypothetical protein
MLALLALIAAIALATVPAIVAWIRGVETGIYRKETR